MLFQVRRVLLILVIILSVIFMASAALEVRGGIPALPAKPDSEAAR